MAANYAQKLSGHVTALRGSMADMERYLNERTGTQSDFYARVKAMAHRVQLDAKAMKKFARNAEVMTCDHHYSSHKVEFYNCPKCRSYIRVVRTGPGEAA